MSKMPELIGEAILLKDKEILRLRAENEKLQWELGKALDTLVVHDAVCAENEKLRAALAAERRRTYEEAAEDIEKLRAAIVEKETVMKIRAASASTMDG